METQSSMKKTMSVLETIKNRATTRKYKKLSIPSYKLNTILEAGIWGPAIHHFQPWKFVVVKNEAKKNKIFNMVEAKLKKIKTPAFISYPTITTLKAAKLLICVYNTKVFSRAIQRLNQKIYKNFEVAEISAIAAAIQNMLLASEYLGIGSCWLDLPLFCRKEINALLKQQDELIAVITLGYPEKQGVRSPRKPLSESITYC
jgi:nitroreductase